MLTRSKWVNALLSVSCSERAEMLPGFGVPVTSKAGMNITGKPLPAGSGASAGGGAVATTFGVDARRCATAMTIATAITAITAAIGQRISHRRSRKDND